MNACDILAQGSGCRLVVFFLFSHPAHPSPRMGELGRQYEVDVAHWIRKVMSVEVRAHKKVVIRYE